MRIVVTGAAGFVGRALVARLRAIGHDVVATDRMLVDGIAGDLCDRSLIERVFADCVDAVAHLATIPGGGAERDPGLAWAVNVEASRAVIDAAARDTARVVFASSIAVFGDPLPSSVDDSTPIAPRLLYGAHKAMIEEWIACKSRRGAIQGLSLRLPGIVARPPAPSGMISAFMSDLFHALRAGQRITLPVSRQATSWLLSRTAAVDAFVHALTDGSPPPAYRLNLPSLRIAMGALVEAVAERVGCDPALVSYCPQPAIEDAFGRHPELSTPLADAIGFKHDGTIERLVARVFDDLDGRMFA